MSALRTLALLALLGVRSGRTSDCSYRGLLTHLNLTTTNDVLKVMRPVKNWTTPTFVQTDMLLYGILEVDEQSQTVTTHVWIQMRWTNEFLTWNPADFCGIDEMNIPLASVWIPDVTITEDASDSGSSRISPVFRLTSEGLLMTNRQQRLTSTCLLNLLLFPFDTQRCNITFSSLTSSAKTITLGTAYDDALLTTVSEEFMVTRGEWRLENIEITYNKTFGYKSQVIYTITMSRKPMLYVVIFIMPLLYFVLLDVASFFINESRGEKLSFKVTVLLSISVLLLILKDLLPSTEAHLPMIAMYCAGIFALVGISVLEAMLVSFLLDLDGYCNDCKSGAGAVEDLQLEVCFHNEPDGAEGTPETSSVPPAPPDERHLLELILEEVKTTRREAGGRHEDGRRPGRYSRLAKIIDSVFFTLYFLCAFAFLSYMNLRWVIQVL